MKCLHKIKSLLFCFACVTTLVVFVTAVYINVFFPNTTLGVEILWQILCVSFLCSLGVLIYPEREVRAGFAVFLTALHYLEVNIVVLGCGLRFGWFYPDNLPMVLGMLLVIALVFVSVSTILWSKNRQIAARMNERLKKYQEADTP